MKPITYLTRWVPFCFLYRFCQRVVLWGTGPIGELCLLCLSGFEIE